MVYYRSCPKCRGDMHIRRDFYGDFRECLQCGLMQDLNTKIDASTGSEKVGVGQASEKHEAA
jgi:DNA-directed RNA polymerase subunit M/transcription elongation factor TFIIS